MSHNENSNSSNTHNIHNNNNGTTVRGGTATTISATKLCHIVKRSNFEGYGFNLHSEKVKPGQYIGKVDMHSPAEAAGLKEGDRIIEVNGVNIGQETHKQVVQRIKAIANEVRLVLIDVDGGKQQQQQAQSAAIAMNNANNNNSLISNDSNMLMASCQGTVQEIPGVSANISSISLITTKRMSNASGNNGGSSSSETAGPAQVGDDLTDDVALAMEAVPHHNGATAIHSTKEQQQLQQQQHDYSSSNNSNMTAVVTPKQAATSGAGSDNSNNSTAIVNRTTINNGAASGGGISGTIGGLQLPVTAAEMRAKLLSKKKYDPKNESVDLKKKFEIIQKL